MIDFNRPSELLAQLSGKGRTIKLIFKDIQENGVERLESIAEIDNALENKIGTDYCIFTDLPLINILEKVKLEFGINSIQTIEQTDSKMEEYFRIKALEVPKIE